ncbi:MAG: dihydroneopterin aldolase [Clostridia bacterium]|nr:dihydroneopterin aldolase [Clostridia bacterium]
MDKIIIKGLKLFAYHGVNEEEKIKGQNFELDITVWLELEKPCETDNVEDTVSYAKIIKKVREVFTAEKYDLLEKAAQVVSDAIFAEFPKVSESEILLKKPEAPIRADFNYVAVEIRRKRNG